MLKIQKRPRDWNDDMNVDPCSTHRPLAASPLLTTPKRLRTGLATPTSQSPIKVDSPFQHQQMESSSVEIPTQTQTKKPKPEATAEKLFTYDEVREIVNRVVAEREAALRAEYDVILQERLQEQFKSFAKFNEDYISRQLKQSDFSYLS
jgi:hypothetical protein